MTYRELTMIQIRDILRRWQAGGGLRTIASGACVDRKTVRRYTEAAIKCGLAKDRELTDDDVAKVSHLVQGREPGEPSDQRVVLAQHRERIVKWLSANKPLRMTKVLRLLRERNVDASYSTLRRYVEDDLGLRGRKSTIRIDDCEPGQEAQVDFGRMGLLLDETTGKNRVLWALIVTLVYSRLSFVWPTFEQSLHDVCTGLDEAWRFFGGVARVIIPDNMKSIVLKPDPLSPVIAPSFLEYAEARGFFTDPARVRSPKDKPRVENTVPYVREDWFEGERFESLLHAREHAATWCRDIAGARVHGTTRQIPREVYESIERPRMLPPPDAAFDVPSWVEAKVHDDHHVQVAYALYSVPTKYLRLKVRVRVDSKTVRIYLGAELIKTHARVAAGKRSTDTSDYPVGKAAYATRSIDGLIEQSSKHGEHVHRFVTRLLSGPLPWARMRQAYALMRLCHKHTSVRVDEACRRALEFDVVDVRRIGGMLQNAQRAEQSATLEGKLVPMPKPRFLREQEDFKTPPAGGQHNDGGAR